jgi:hypothetical protein
LVESGVYVWDVLGFGDSRLAPDAEPSIARQARTPAELDRLVAAIPGAVRETVPGAGHFAAEDNPHDVAEALLRFLA